MTAAVTGTVYAAIKIGYHFAEISGGSPDDPFAVLAGVFSGTLTWPPQATLVVIIIVAVAILVAVAIGAFLARHRRRASRVDHTTRYLGRGQDIAALTHKSATQTATRLGVTDAPGVPIGVTVASRQQLYGSWEDMHIDIWGPRTGKTTSRAVPAILSAPGPVLVTSNKRDVLDATRDIRAESGPVFVFDPQNVAGEQAHIWWNPLSYVTDEVRAARMAEHSRRVAAKSEPEPTPTSTRPARTSSPVCF